MYLRCIKCGEKINVSTQKMWLKKYQKGQMGYVCQECSFNKKILKYFKPFEALERR